jgi:hypothetical protein
MATAGYQASIKKSGTSTSFTGESMSNVTGNIFQIDDAAKEIFNRDSTFTFYEDSVAISTSDISSIDYLYGKVTFATSKTGSITVDGDYMPIAVIAGASQATQNQTQQIIDTTDFSNSGYKTKIVGLQDIVISVSRFDDVSNDFQTLLESRTPLVIEFLPTSGDTNRGWYVLDSTSSDLSLEDALTEGLNFQLTGDVELGKTFSRS